MPIINGINVETETAEITLTNPGEKFAFNVAGFTKATVHFSELAAPASTVSVHILRGNQDIVDPRPLETAQTFASAPGMSAAIDVTGFTSLVVKVETGNSTGSGKWRAVCCKKAVPG